MNPFNSRKLAALVSGHIAILVVAGFSAFGHPVPEMDKVLLAITTTTLTAIGAQTILDKGGQGENGSN